MYEHIAEYINLFSIVTFEMKKKIPQRKMMSQVNSLLERNVSRSSLIILKLFLEIFIQT